MDFTQLVEDHQKAIFAYLKRLVRDYQLAEDLCQETLLRAFHVFRRGDLPQHPRPWLLCVARNLAFDSSRRRGLIAVDSEKLEELAAREWESPKEDSLPCAAVNDGVEIGPLLREGLEELAESDRDILAHRYREGMPFWEIAMRNGLSNQNTKMRLFRSRRKLRRILRSRMRRPEPFVTSQAG